MGPKDFRVVGQRDSEDKAAYLHFRQFDLQASQHYRQWLEECEDADTHLYHLIHIPTSTVVGFLCVRHSLEQYGAGTSPTAYVALEYVYVAPKYRGLKLTRGLMREALKSTKRWLRGQRSEHSNMTCMPGVSIVSDGGHAFAKKLYRKLKAWCKKNEVDTSNFQNI